MPNHNSRLLRENLEMGDLKRLVHNELHIDEYKSKMGTDADVVVVSFKVAGKEPSADLVSFVEKGYGYVLDADVSSGEKEGGDYLVFIEMERTAELPEQLVQMMEDLMNLTKQKIEDWRVRYQKSSKDHPMTVDTIKSIVPLTPEEYEKKYGDIHAELDSMKAIAGVPVTTKAPKNKYTESLRIAAGLK
jgi:hypothetical protein